MSHLRMCVGVIMSAMSVVVVAVVCVHFLKDSLISTHTHTHILTHTLTHTCTHTHAHSHTPAHTHTHTHTLSHTHTLTHTLTHPGTLTLAQTVGEEPESSERSGKRGRKERIPQQRV